MSSTDLFSPDFRPDKALIAREALYVLKNARARISWGWTQNRQAEDKDGMMISPCDKYAVAWCPVGAMRADLPEELLSSIQGPVEHVIASQILITAGLFPDDGDYLFQLTYWNDEEGMTQEEVLRVFDLAISAAEKGDWR